VLGLVITRKSREEQTSEVFTRFHWISDIAQAWHLQV
jgi:hypothetical protein